MCALAAWNAEFVEELLHLENSIHISSFLVGSFCTNRQERREKSQAALHPCRQLVRPLPKQVGAV